MASSLTGMLNSATSLLASRLGFLEPLKSATEAAWSSLGKAFLGLVVPLEAKIGGMGVHTLTTMAVFWPSYIILYNFYRAIDKHDFLGLRKYKIHPDRDELQELNDKVVGGMKKGWWLGVLRNMAAYGVFFSYGRQPVNSWPATPWAMFRTLLTAYIVFDFGFYWMHRMEHLPYFYKWMHKQHHEFKVTNAAATSWNNASESFAIMVLGNLTALAFKMDLATWLGWVLWSQVMDFQVHVGYVIPYNPANLICPPLIHDFHHYQNRGNFATSHWDMVFGTDKNWKAWKKRQEERKAEGLGMEAERRTDDDEETEAAKKAQ